MKFTRLLYFPLLSRLQFCGPYVQRQNRKCHACTDENNLSNPTSRATRPGEAPVRSSVFPLPLPLPCCDGCNGGGGGAIPLVGDKGGRGNCVTAARGKSGKGGENQQGKMANVFIHKKSSSFFGGWQKGRRRFCFMRFTINEPSAERTTEFICAAGNKILMYLSHYTV